MLKFNECIKSGKHLTETDNDGFCQHCGHQDSGYTIKVWHTEDDYNKGNSEFDSFNPDMNKAIDYAIATLNYVYAIEVYETETGETVYHSEE